MRRDIAEPAWQRQAGRVLHWKDWGGDSLVYDERSGQTFQFPPLAAAVLACLDEQALSEDELATWIARDLGADVDNALRSAVKSSLEQFHRLGWIHPTSME